MRRKVKDLVSLKAIKYLSCFPLVILKLKNWPVFLLNCSDLKDSVETYLFQNGLRIKTGQRAGTAWLF